MNDKNFVWKLCKFYNSQKENDQNAIFFWEIDLQSFFSGQDEKDSISKGLASLIIDDEFTSNHMPAFLWWIRANATLYTLNSWRQIVAPRLENAINCQRDLIYNKVTDFNSDFSLAFKEWAENEFYNDMSKYDYYQLNSGNSRWRVHLINSECLLSPANDNISSSFFDMPLGNFLDFDEEILAERFNQQAGENLDNLLPLKDWLIYAGLLLKKINEFLIHNDNRYPTNETELINIIDSCKNDNNYGFPLIASNKLKEHAKHIDFNNQLTVSPRQQKKINFRCYLYDEKPSFNKIKYLAENVSQGYFLKVSSLSGFSKTLYPIECTSNSLTFAYKLEIPNWIDDYTFQIYDQHMQVVFSDSRRWSTPALFAKKNQDNFWTRVERSSIRPSELTDQLRFYPSTPNKKPTITPTGHFSIKDNEDGSFILLQGTGKPERKITISSDNYNWILVYATNDSFQVSTSIIDSKIKGTYKNQSTPVFLLGENPEISVRFDFITATNQESVEEKLAELNLEIHFQNNKYISKLNCPGYFILKCIKTTNHKDWLCVYELALPRLQFNNDDPLEASLSAANNIQLFWIFPFNTIKSSQIINPQTKSITFSLENETMVSNRSCKYDWPSGFVPDDNNDLRLHLAWKEANGLNCNTQLGFKCNGVWFVRHSGNEKNELDVLELGNFLIDNKSNAVIKICHTGQDPFLTIASDGKKSRLELAHQSGTNLIELRKEFFIASTEFKNFLGDKQNSFFCIALNDNQNETNSIKISLLPIIENFSASISNNFITCETKVTHAAYSPGYLIKISQQNTQIAISNLDLYTDGKIYISKCYLNSVDCRKIHGDIDVTLIDQVGEIISGPIQLTIPQAMPDLHSVLCGNNLVNAPNLNAAWLINELNNLTLNDLEQLDFNNLLNIFNPDRGFRDLSELLAKKSEGWPLIQNFYNPNLWNLHAFTKSAPNGVAFIVLASGILIAKYKLQSRLFFIQRDDIKAWEEICNYLISNSLPDQKYVTELRKITWT